MKTSPISNARRRWLIAGAALSCTGLVQADTPQRKDWPRQRATPALQLPKNEGGTWQLADARGHPVLLNFWATWCEPCRTEMPALQQLATEHQAQGLQLMAVNFREDEARVRRFAETTGFALPVLFDRDGAAARSFDVRIFPSTIAIDRQGRARFVVTGEFDWRSALAKRWLAEVL